MKEEKNARSPRTENQGKTLNILKISYQLLPLLTVCPDAFERLNSVPQTQTPVLPVQIKNTLITANRHGVTWVLESERSNHLTTTTGDHFPLWPSRIHPWKQEACEAGGLQRWEMKISPSQRDDTGVSEAREETVTFITFTCPHYNRKNFAGAPNPNVLFPEFGSNRL